MSTRRADVVLLWRRSGFGANSAQIDAAAKAGLEATLEQLLAA